jgi:hypothetical protein
MGNLSLLEYKTTSLIISGLVVFLCRGGPCVRPFYRKIFDLGVGDAEDCNPKSLNYLLNKLEKYVNI